MAILLQTKPNSQLKLLFIDTSYPPKKNNTRLFLQFYWLKLHTMNKVYSMRFSKGGGGVGG